MRNSRYRLTRLMMVIDAIVVTLVGVLLIAIPGRVLPGYSVDTIDSQMQVLITYFALALVGLGIHAATTSRYAGDPAFRRTTLLSVVIKLLFAFSLSRPNGLFQDAAYAFAIENGLFALLFLVTLPIKSIGYKEEK